MAIISTIGRKSTKVRFLLGGIYVALIVGAFSMLYPFMIMVAGSSKSGVDSPDAEIIPRFLIDEEVFYRKCVEAFFNEAQTTMQSAYATDSGFRSLSLPTGVNEQLVREWRRFETQCQIPVHAYEMAFAGYGTSRNIQPEMLRRFKADLKAEYKGSITQMNQALNTGFTSWNSVFIRPQNHVQRRVTPSASPYASKWREFRARQPVEYRVYTTPGLFFREGYLRTQYSDLQRYNREHGTRYSSWDQITLTRRYPAGDRYTDKQREDWITFVRSIINLYWIRADDAALPLYQAFLKDKYAGDIGNYNKLYNTNLDSFAQIERVRELPVEGVIVSDWDAFVQGWKNPETGHLHILPENLIAIHSIPFLFRDYMLERHGSLAAINEACGTSLQTIEQLNIPQQDANLIFFRQNKTALKWEFLTRNFIAVNEYIFLQGNAILNTVIYCALAVLSCLLVNPLAAYALSRYKPRATYKILLFLMLTMAFPPMVTSIPSFLILRELNMLNTFFALVLPGAANGYSIFLLKGFFDSLPQELYESAELDGAGEMRIFWQITMSLSKPILAVISLQAFNLAYANFMMALLICQDQEMWTLMPWLYQLQQRSCEGIVFSSLLVAAIPTFLIFVFCQNIIMRGIVVPVEK